LEVARSILPFASESDLWALFPEEGGDLFVRDIADLVVVVDDLAVLVTDTAFAGSHQGVASFVFGANVAVNTGPSLIAVASAPGTHRAVLSSSE
jgi:hypothetical protein